MIFFKLFFNIFLLLKINETYENHVIYPFKKVNNSQLTTLQNLLQNDLQITLEIGTPPQKMNLNLRSQAYAFFVSGSEVPYNIPKYNEKQSSSFKKDYPTALSFKNLEYSKGYKISESLIINGEKIDNITLVLASQIIYFQSGALGLKLVNNHEVSDDLSFIYQLKKSSNFDNYGFYLKYNDSGIGEIVIGTYPHLIDKNFNEKNFMYKSTGTINRDINWVIDFDYFKYDNQIINNVTSIKSLINLEFGLICAPFSMKSFFDELYLSNNFCHQNLVDEYYIYRCDLIKTKIESFKNISFVLKEFNYTFNFSYKDLFIKKEKEYIFSIVFSSSQTKTNWIMGETFLKKYQLVFDLDKKIIGTYIKINNETDPKKFNSLIIIIIIFGILILFLVIYIFTQTKKKRKVRANELEDNYSPIPS